MKKHIKKALAMIMVITVIASNMYLFASASEVRYSSWGSWSDWSTTAQTDSSTKEVQTRTETFYYHYCRQYHSGPQYGSDSPTYHELPAGTAVAFVGYLNGYEMYLSHCRAEDANGKAVTGTYNGYNVSGLTSTYMCANTCYLWHPSTRTYYRYRTRTATTYYYVSYNANGGSGAPSTQEKASGTTLTLSSVVPTKSATVTYNANGGSISTSSKSYTFTFNKWNTTSAGNGTSYSKGASYTANADATLYAQWTAPTYGTLPTPTRSGYQFAGWYTSATGGNKVSSTTSITGSTTIYAHWNEEYSVNYNANGGSGAPSAQTKVEGTNLTLSSVTPTREGYTFVNWNTKSDGSGTLYNAGATYSSNSAATLYAQWSVNKYSVTYNVDGKTYKTIEYAYGDDIVTPADPVKTGYVFEGWKLLPSIMPAENITSDAEFTANYKLFLNNNNSPVNIVVGDSFSIPVSFEPTPDSAPSVEWKSENTDVAIVDGNGNVTAVSCGKTNIIVTSEDGISSVIEINVNHDFTTTIIEPTCDDRGASKHECNNCDYSFEDNIIPALGHADKDNNGLCDNCSKELNHVDNNGDGLCDNCKKELNHFDKNNDGLCDHCKKEVNHKDANKDGYCDHCNKLIDPAQAEKRLLDSVQIYVPKSTSIAWKSHVAFKVAAKGVPKGYSMMVYFGKNIWEVKPDNDGDCYFETDIGNITTTGRVSVRIVKDGVPKANSSGALDKDFVMTVKSAFGDKLSATFKYVINFFRRPYVLLTY